VYNTTIVVSVGGSMGSLRVNGMNFVFPTLRKRQGEETHDVTRKLANGLAEYDFFMWRQHPAIHIAKPEFYIGLMMYNVLNGLCDLT
jgi:hypothetical protein